MAGKAKPEVMADAAVPHLTSSDLAMYLVDPPCELWRTIVFENSPIRGLHPSGLEVYNPQKPGETLLQGHCP